MKTTHILAGALCFSAFNVSFLSPAQAADQEKTNPGDKGGAEMSAAEKKFQETLSNCVFQGRWCLVKDGQLGEEREEKYTILRASKTSGDNWLIFARVQYGQKDVMVPIPVQVKWAGDTPVITLDNMSIPNLGTYSARVVVHNNSYAGTWSAGDHGGMLHGLIEKGKPASGNSESKQQ
ncbi:MAG: hypothetical protein ACO1QB_01710 [Verrucomicrobiales bacterium]